MRLGVSHFVCDEPKKIWYAKLHLFKYMDILFDYKKLYLNPTINLMYI
jgi:hypothetical protein